MNRLVDFTGDVLTVFSCIVALVFVAFCCIVAVGYLLMMLYVAFLWLSEEIGDFIYWVWFKWRERQRRNVDKRNLY